MCARFKDRGSAWAKKGTVQVGGMTSRTIREMVVPPLRNAGAGLPLSVLVEVDGLMLLIVSPRTS